ncbi:MAG: DUF1566 domain-containing protein [Acidobacteriota bacterium]
MKTTVLSLALLLFAPALLHAQLRGTPTSWWPDPATGLLWTGWPREADMNYADAQSYCSSLLLGGYSQWRLPTLGELDPLIVEEELGEVTDPSQFPVMYLTLTFDRDPQISGWLWSTTPSQFGSLTTARMGQRGSQLGRYASSKPTDYKGHSALCVRAMDPDLLALATAAHPVSAVRDLKQLQAISLAAKSHADFGAGQFQSAMDDARQSLLLNAEPINFPAYIDAAYNIGLAYGLLGQWDESLKTLQAMHKKYGNFSDIGVNLKLTKQFQKQSQTDPNALPEWRLAAEAKEALEGKDFKRCIDLANQMIQIEPASPLGYQYLGLAQQSLQQFDQAVASLKKAWQLDKSDKGNSKYRLNGAKSEQARLRRAAKDSAKYAAKYGTATAIP